MIQEGSIPENSYKLVKDDKYCGEVKVALTFTPEVIRQYNLFFYIIFLQSFMHIFLPIKMYYQLLVAEKLRTELQSRGGDWRMETIG